MKKKERKKDNLVNQIFLLGKKKDDKKEEENIVNQMFLLGSL